MRTRSLAFSLFVMTVALPALCPGVSAAEADPSARVTALSTQVKQVLGDKSLSSSERQQHFRSLLDADFDFPMISRFVLGRYWQGSSEPFRDEFSRVFEDYVIQSLSAQLAAYADELLIVTATRAEGERSTIVSTTIAHADGAPPAKVDWRVESTPGGLKISDVSVSGISMALAYREQFAAVIEHDGGQVTALIPALRRQLDRQASNSAPGNAQASQGSP